MSVSEIRSKLQNGSTINEICNEYNLTFNKVFEMMKDFQNDTTKNHPNSTTPLLYITKSQGKFYLRKNNTHYGVYNTLEDAKKVRDYFICNGWHVKKIDKACKAVNVKRCTKDYTNIKERNGRFYIRGSENGKYKFFGSYRTFEDAEKVRDYCVKHGWKRKCIDEYCRILGVKRIRSTYELQSNESLYH